jgi:uncharacterized protein (TIGR02186 family)
MKPLAALASLLGLLLALAAAPVRAETLVTALSADRVDIRSNFTGTQIVVFGTIERDAQTISRAARYDVVVTVSGPPVNVVTRRKERVFGIWINRDAEVMSAVPSFLAVHATRQLDALALPTARARLGLGLDMLPINAAPTADPPVRTDFEDAFLRRMQEEGRYRYAPGGVQFLSERLFRASVVLPATVGVGSYTARVHLFREGVLLSTTEGVFDIRKVGFEQVVSRYARVYGLQYGLAAVVIACLTGWLAGVIFRRD